ncbi:MAG: hypothetical protein RMK18_10275 [Armatimonadota bacterium]|nr:hypothetical protein [Armatimonadota bacterium]MDW8026230.1 hypothetical protein [Armatimonadota bacterium]
MYEQWKKYCLTHGQAFCDFKPYFMHESFAKLRRKGREAVVYFIEKIKEGEIFDFAGPFGIVYTISELTKTRFEVIQVYDPHSRRMRVAIEEFPEFSLKIQLTRPDWRKQYAKY